MLNKPRFIVIHCSDVSSKTVFDQYNSINQTHRNRGFTKSILGGWVGYHVLITGEKLYKCKETWEEGCHTNQYYNDLSVNFQSLGICIGFDGDIEYPTTTQYNLLQQQVLTWMKEFSIPKENVKMHRFYEQRKTCPGVLITQEWINRLIEPPTEDVKPLPQLTKQIEIQSQNTIRLQIIDLAKQAVYLLKQLLTLRK